MRKVFSRAEGPFRGLSSFSSTRSTPLQVPHSGSPNVQPQPSSPGNKLLTNPSPYLRPMNPDPKPHPAAASFRSNLGAGGMLEALGLAAPGEGDIILLGEEVRRPTL